MNFHEINIISQKFYPEHKLKGFIQKFGAIRYVDGSRNHLDFLLESGNYVIVEPAIIFIFILEYLIFSFIMNHMIYKPSGISESSQDFRIMLTKIQCCRLLDTTTPV